MNPRSRPRLACLLGAAFVASAGVARAEGDEAEPATAPATEIDPAAPHALGRVFTAGPAPKGLTLLASGGYAYTESVLGMADTHHRAAGSLALDERPVTWLDFAFRLDGRYDAHVVPGQPTDTGLVGDPRLYARGDKAWAGGLALGARAGLWLPGRNAPSVDLSAASPELVGALSYAPRASALALTANAGFRLDRSARSASDAAQLSAGDRLALEVSAFNEVLLGAAATFGRGRGQGFVEGSWDLLVGAGAPPPRSSPILVGAGGRLALGRSLRFEAELEASPSSRPAVGPTAPLVPVPPRVAFWLGLTYAFSAAAPPPAPPPPPAAPPSPPPEPASPPAAPPPAAKPEEPQTPKGQIRGLVRSLKGTAVAAEVTIEPEAPAPGAAAADAGPAPPEGSAKGNVTPRADGGRFKVDVAPGRYRVTISAPGFQSQKRTIDVEENGVTLLNVDLRSER
jgi:hypothetical protein